MNAPSPSSSGDPIGDKILRTLRLRHLQLLSLLRDDVSLRTAAAKLNLTEPAASKMLRGIEETVGVVLFERSSRGIRANAAGLAFIKRAHGIVREIGVTAQEQHAIAEGATSVLRIGALPYVGAGRVAVAIASVQQRFPGMRVSVRGGVARFLLSHFLDRQLDLMVCGLDADLPDIGEASGIESVRLYADHVHVVTSTRNPLANERALTWDDLAEKCWILPFKENQLWQTFAATLLRLGYPLPRATYEVSAPAMVASLVRAGDDTFGLMRRDSYLNEMQRGGLIAIDVRPRIELPPVCAYFRRQDYLNSGTTFELVEELKRSFAGEAALQPRQESVDTSRSSALP